MYKTNRRYQKKNNRSRYSPPRGRGRGRMNDGAQPDVGLNCPVCKRLVIFPTFYKKYLDAWNREVLLPIHAKCLPKIQGRVYVPGGSLKVKIKLPNNKSILVTPTASV